MKILCVSSVRVSKTDTHSVFGFIYMTIARSKLMKLISKHVNKVSSEPENMTEIIHIEVEK